MGFEERVKSGTVKQAGRKSVRNKVFAMVLGKFP
jgi:hypothetical protein